MRPVDTRLVLSTWWPLAASWLMMGVELPLVSAAIARLPDPQIHLAAYGGIVFPLALLVEAPIIMLLAASTSLSRDRGSYRKLRRFMIVGAVGLTGLHLLVVATPVYDFVAGTLLDAPDAIRAPARWGLWIMTPWTAAIAYRRFQQGLLIRFGRSSRVGLGTAVRILTNLMVLATLARFTDWPGIVVGAAGVAAGVTAEAVFSGIAVRPVLRHDLPARDPSARPLTRARFVRFYSPLATTSILSLLALPLGSAAMGRMPMALESLAVWPVISGLVFMLRSLGFAFNEVVVALLDREGAAGPLRRFAAWLALGVTATLAIVAATPLADGWLRDVSGLDPALSHLARQALWIALLLPAGSVAQAFYTGTLVNRHATRGVFEAVFLALLVLLLVLAFTVPRTTWPGIFTALGAALAAQAFQVVWLARRVSAHWRADLEPRVG